mmetsp:Transcript_32119/g.51952  ORF Transcript_32119/g.51952 Transcript_32119/m.51952 type:complete len:203 (-) Transcript_32119:704-1312(-)
MGKHCSVGMLRKISSNKSHAIPSGEVNCVFSSFSSSSSSPLSPPFAAASLWPWLHCGPCTCAAACACCCSMSSLDSMMRLMHSVRKGWIKPCCITVFGLLLHNHVAKLVACLRTVMGNSSLADAILRLNLVSCSTCFWITGTLDSTSSLNTSMPAITLSSSPRFKHLSITPTIAGIKPSMIATSSLFSRYSTIIPIDFTLSI